MKKYNIKKLKFVPKLILKTIPKLFLILDKLVNISQYFRNFNKNDFGFQHLKQLLFVINWKKSYLKHFINFGRLVYILVLRLYLLLLFLKLYILLYIIYIFFFIIYFFFIKSFLFIYIFFLYMSLLYIYFFFIFIFISFFIYIYFFYI